MVKVLTTLVLMVPLLVAPVSAEETFINSISQKIVYLKPGEFTMGSPKTEKGRGRDEAQVNVVLSKAFYLSETEVTQEQWTAVMGTTITNLIESSDGPIGRGAKLVSKPSAEGSIQPMVFVNWGDAMQFCEELTKKDTEAGKIPEGYYYTLPTEAQWEYSCRSGTGTVFSYGDTLVSEQANFYGVISYGVEKKGVYREKTTDVKTFEPNAWGLYDMHGNVYEWCLDCYHDKLIGGDNPFFESEDREGKIIRGGTWNRRVTSCRSAYRYSALEDRRTYNIGFRVALVASD